MRMYFILFHIRQDPAEYLIYVHTFTSRWSEQTTTHLFPWCFLLFLSFSLLSLCCALCEQYVCYPHFFCHLIRASMVFFRNYSHSTSWTSLTLHTLYCITIRFCIYFVLPTYVVQNGIPFEFANFGSKLIKWYLRHVSHFHDRNQTKTHSQTKFAHQNRYEQFYFCHRFSFFYFFSTSGLFIRVFDSFVCNVIGWDLSYPYFKQRQNA